MATLLPALAWWSGPATANPRGGVVVHGDIAMSGSGGVLNIKQTSANAIIDWEAFSIEAGEMTRFIQPGTSAAVLNRVTGGNASEIHGALRANGNVFVINPNGILVGPGGTIDVHGLVLSTLDVDNGEFLAGGDRVFKGASSAGVTNLGRIHAIGGDVFLIGRTVTNSGSIHAPSGTVGLAAGQEVLIKADTGPDGERIFIRATGAGAGGTGILNDGTIEGAAAELKAHGNHYALAINNKGSIRATGVHRSGGRVHLQGIGGRVSNSGSIRATSSGAGKAGAVLIAAAYAKVDGELRASGHSIGGSVRIAATEAAEIGATIAATGRSGVGGSVDVEAPDIVLKSGSSIEVGGTTGGGSVRIGGGFQGGDPAFANARALEMESGAAIHADATETGNGGSVVLWSDGDTLFRGEITALGRGSGRGGMVEVSGREGLLVDGTVSTLAESGAHGTLLLDPRNLTISNAASTGTNLNNSTLASLVAGNHVVVSTLDSGTAEAGHIAVLNPVVYTSANSLTLLAEGDLYIGDDVINRGAGDVNLVAGWNPAVRPLGSLFGGSPGSPGSSTVTGAPDMNELIFDTPGSFGNGNGSVYVGLRGTPGGDPSLVAADRSVVVASRNGQTNVAGYDVNVWGPALTGGIETGQQRYAQIGYNRRDAGTASVDPDPVLGGIRVKAVNDVSLVANKHDVGALGLGPGGWGTGTTNTGYASFAQIGHGGERDSVRGMKLSGEIIVEAGNDVSLLGGRTINNHAQIGHGGYDNTGTTNFTATLGGDITVNAGRDVTVVGGLGYLAHAQIGHGAFQHLLADFAESTIDVDAGRNVTVRGGAGTSGPENSTYARAQIGHGSHASDFVDAGGAVLAPGSGKGFKGAVTVDAGGAIRLEAGHYDANNFAVIGHGGNASDGDHSGVVNVTAGTGLELLSGTGADYLFTQIGHLSMNSANAISGDVHVTVEDGRVLLRGGGSTVGHASIGSGGYVIGEGSHIDGGTYVTLKGTDATDGLVMESGNGSYSSAQIGHTAQRGSAGPVITLSGDVAVDVAAGGLNMQSSANGYFSQTMIGHGGRDINGVKNGNIWVNVAAGDISLLGGGSHASARYNHAQIGHGGYGNGVSGTIDSGTGFADILDGGGNVVGQRRLGIVVTAEAGNIVLKGGLNDHSYAQIGHGGLSASAATVTDIGGDITVAASGQVLAEAGGTRSGNFALIGHGGVSNAGARSGDVSVTAGNGVELLAGGTGGGILFAQVGHLAYGSVNAIDGDVRVTAEDGRVLLRGGGSGSSHAAIGSGGYNLLGGSRISGGTYVTLKGTDATDGLVMESGNGSHAAAHVGHLAQRESLTTAIDLSGDVEVDVAAGGLSMTASALGYFSHVMIGHGGREMAGSKSGDIRVTVASGDLSALAGGTNASLRYNHAQIGHGGYSNGGAMVASSGSGFADILDGGGNVVGQRPLGIVVQVLDGSIELLAGKNGGSYAQIGHGGLRSGTANTADFTGDVTVEASGDLSMGEGTASYAYAQIGHGGPGSASNFVWNLGGAIAVTAGGSVTAKGGSASITNVQIGHGGYATTTTSSIAASPITVKAATGDVLLLSGTAGSTGAKIGHGGYNMKLSSFGESPVTVEAGRHVRLVSPQFETFVNATNAGTQIGHGGFGAVVGPVSGASALGYSGNIVVKAGGKLDVIAGKNAGSYNWSLLGHTSYFNSNGVHRGDITVTTGTLAGLAPADYGITVQAAYGDYMPLATTDTNINGYYSFASIGHRGHSNASATYSTGLHGDILVDAVRGGILVAGGDGVDGTTAANDPPEIRLHGASIGHGGYAAGHLTEGLTGSVKVHAEGDIALRSGTSRQGTVMIGHGGYAAFGPMEGDIEVVSRNGSLELDSTLAINTTRGGVMIGHGAPSNAGSGTRQGDILVDVAGEISLVRTVANLSYIGHRSGTANAISNADVTIRGRSFDRATGDSGSQILRPDAELGTMLANNLAGGNLSLVGMGTTGIEMDIQMLWTSPYDFNLLAYSDIFIANDLINRGDGDLNLFAGWNPELAPLHASGDILPPLATASPWRGYLIRDIDADAQLFDVPGAYGNGGGSVWVGAYADLSAADRSVAVASRAGQTNVAGHDVNVWGPAFTGGINQGAQRYAQIGYNRRDAGTATSLAATGRIRVGAVNDIAVVANKYEVGIRGSSGWIATTDNTGNASFAQIGHGGERDSVTNMELSGDILVEAGGNLSLLGGLAYNNHATIGHGGYDNRDTAFPGVASIKGGDISVTVGGDVTLQAGFGYHANVQIGHGGGNVILADFVESKITVNAGGDVTVRGGAGVAGTESNSRAQAQIGHGGYDADFVDPTTGAVRTAGSGYGYKGDIEVAAGGAVLVEAGNHDAYNLAAIGNGGVAADGDHSGDITVTAGAGIELRSGTGTNYNFAQIGHFNHTAHGDLSGEITVTAQGGALLLQSVDSLANANPVLIGHGGIQSNGKRIGDITATAANGVSLLAGSGADTLFTQIGHLSYRSLNEIDGQVTVVSQDGGILLQGGGSGNRAASYAVIGSSGGYDPTGGTTISGGTRVVSLGTDPEDGIVLKSGNDSYSSAHIGHLVQRTPTSAAGSVELSGDVEVEVAGGGIQMQSSALGLYSHTMIGHGGSYAVGGKSGDIRVTVASGDLSAKAGGTNAGERYNHTQIGHGGYSRGGAMTASSGSGFADILDGNGNVVGQRALGIVVRVLDGNIELLAGGAIANYAQIGHGGIRAGVADTADFVGDITVEASGDISMGEGSAGYSYAQIGHGGAGAVANNVWNLGGAIAVSSGGSITAQGGSVGTTYTQIGHGGVATTTDSSIAASPITVTAAGDVLLLAGAASTAGAKIGHGNNGLRLSSFGESPVTVEAGRHIRLVSPQFDSYRAVSSSGTQIGHGGTSATVRATDGAVLGYSGNLDVTAGGKIDLLAGKNAATFNWSLIGHTSFNSSNSQGVHSGDITVNAGTVAGLGDYGLVVQAASGDYNGVANVNTSYYSFASVGHRGHSSGTILSGDILVDVQRGGVTVQGGNGQPGTTSDNENTPADLRLHGASIGHGGYNVTSGMSGDVRVHSQGDILLRAGTGPGSPVVIGHGGRGAGGPISGLIEVISREGSLELDATLANNVVAYAADAESRGAVYIGHGASGTASGTRQGDILVDVAGEISFVGTDRPGWIGHRTTTANGITNADVTIRARSIDSTSGDSGGGLFRIDAFLGSILSPHLNAGHLSFVATGSEGLEMGGRLVGNSAFDLNLLSRSHIYILDDLLNHGSGDVNVFAGWDPALAPFHPVGETLPTAAGAPSYREYWVRDIDAEAGLFATAGSYGNGGGSVWVGADSTLAAADRSVAVGSRTGQTSVAAHDVHVWGSAQTGGVNLGANKYSQIGYNRADTGGSAGDAATGRIRVSALNDVFLEANRYGVGSAGTGGTWNGVDQTGFASFAKIGHGGERDTLGGTTLSGAILVEAGGDLTLTSGQTLESYTMIGHGGPAYASVSVQTIGDIAVTAGGSIELLGGEGSRASAQIGHGGAVLGGSRTGNVDVVSGAEIVLRAGAGEDGAAHIGHGGTGAGGLSSGDLRVTAATHLLLEAGDSLGSSALIGHGGRQASNTAVGAIVVTAGDDLGLLGGGGIATTAQIGHGGYAFNGTATDQSILVETSGALTLLGGTGRSSNAQIGHGGFSSTGSSLTGAIGVQALGGLDLTGGAGLFAYSQIGHFGHASHARMGGDLSVTSGAHLAIVATNGADSAYAKIGHGHDIQAGILPLVPVQEITGDIRVAVATDLSLTDGMIGHLNATSTATTTGGDTQIAVGTTDPADPSSGTLVADGQSEFHGADGLRFYLPQRINNGIAAGALLNGAVFPGAAPDPYDHQRDDEYTIHILGDTPSSPNEHGNAFGTGPAPSNAAGYAFYYDTITLVAGAGITPPGGGVTPPGGGDDPGITPPNIPLPTLPTDPTEPVDPSPAWWTFFLGDRILDDWLRDREKEFSESGEFEILYENFHQYGLHGESLFRTDRLPR